MAFSERSTSSQSSLKHDITPDTLRRFTTNTNCPLPQRDFARLNKGPSVNIYCGRRPDHVLVAPSFSTALLSTFAPALASGLSGSARDPSHVVLLSDLTPAAVAWFLRLASSNFYNTSISTLSSWPVGSVFDRLRVLLTLGHRSPIERRISQQAKALVLGGRIPAAHSLWLFAPAAPSGVRSLAQSLVKPICCAVLDGTLKSPLAGTLDVAWFMRSMRRAISVRNFDILQRYFAFREPLSHFQMCFVFQFSQGQDRARLSVANGLLWALRQGFAGGVDHVASRTAFPELQERMKCVEHWWRVNGWLDHREWADRQMLMWFERERAKAAEREESRNAEAKAAEVKGAVGEGGERDGLPTGKEGGIPEVEKAATAGTGKRKGRGKKAPLGRVKAKSEKVASPIDKALVEEVAGGDDHIAIVEDLAMQLPIKLEMRRRTKSV